MRAGVRRRHALAALRGLPVETTDGRRIALLCNAASAAEIDAGPLPVRAALGAPDRARVPAGPAWPTEAEHLEQLEPLLRRLRGRVATVRTLDFGADKTPPFLAGTEERGLALTLSRPQELGAQLRAIAHAGAGTHLGCCCRSSRLPTRSEPFARSFTVPSVKTMRSRSER